jgi:hypothetical protein
MTRWLAFSARLDDVTGLPWESCLSCQPTSMIPAPRVDELAAQADGVGLPDPHRQCY